MLTKREFSVAGRYAAGQSHKEIARDLDIAPATVRNHIAAIYRKLAVSNKAQLVSRLAVVANEAGLSRDFATDTLASPALQHIDSARLAQLSRPSVAVMSFANIGAPEQDYFCHGLTLNIHNNLTRFPDLFVSGRSSCLAAGHLVDDSVELALNLGVQYLVRGAVRSHGNDLRVTVQLVDGASAQVLWSEQFERRLGDVLEVETEIANTVAGNLSIRLEDAQYERRGKLSPGELDAYDWQLRGYHSLELGGPGNLDRAEREFGEAIKYDPKSAAAHAGLSMTHGYRCDQLLTGDYAHSLKLHSELAQTAVALDESDSRAHYAMLCALSLKRQFELADQHAMRAVQLNPSEYHNLCSRGYTRMSLDDFEGSVDCFSESLRRNPLAPTSCLLALGLMEYVRADYAQSALAFSRMQPNYLQKASSLAASFGQLGYETDARAAADSFRRDAGKRAAWPADGDGDWEKFWSRAYPHLGSRGFGRLVEGLGKAGLPVNSLG